MRSTDYFVPFKELNLQPGEIEVEFNLEFNQMTITAPKAVVKNLYISHEDKYLRFTDNYFDLVPGYPVKVVLVAESLKDVKDKLRFKGYAQVTKDVKLKVTHK